MLATIRIMVCNDDVTGDGADKRVAVDTLLLELDAISGVGLAVGSRRRPALQDPTACSRPPLKDRQCLVQIQIPNLHSLLNLPWQHRPARRPW